MVPICVGPNCFDFLFFFFFFTLCTLRKHSYNVIHSIFNHFSFLVKKNVFHWYL